MTETLSRSAEVRLYRRDFYDDRSRAACCYRLLLQAIDDRCYMCSPAVIWLLTSQRLTCRLLRRKNIIIYTLRLAMSSSCIASNRDVDVSTWPTMSKKDLNARMAVYACWRSGMLEASCPESALRPHLAPTYSRGTGFNKNKANQLGCCCPSWTGRCIGGIYRGLAVTNNSLGEISAYSRTSVSCCDLAFLLW